MNAFRFFLCLSLGVLILSPVQALAAHVVINATASGGDCAAVGTWNDASSTCTLTGDVVNSIQILSPNTILDCDGHTLRGPAPSDVLFGAGIWLDAGSDGATVRNCDVAEFNEGIVTWGSGNHNIHDNTLHNNALDGLLVAYSDGNIISDNIFSSNDYGLFGFYAGRNTIISNNIHDTLWGIVVVNFSYGSISDNFINTDQHGVYLYESTRIEVSGNSIEGPGAAYAYPYGRGVWVSGGSGDIDVINNYIFDTFIPIYILGWVNNTLISGNTIDTGVWGIATELHHSTIENNDITGMSHTSIDVNGSDNIIANNHLHESTVLRVHSYAIEGGEAHRNIVENNIVENGLACKEPCYTFDYQNEMGILISSISSQRDFGNIDGEGLTDENVIRGNIIRNMVGEGIYLDNAGNNNMVTNNVITKNAGGGITIAHPCPGCNYSFVRNDVYRNGGLPLKSVDTEISGPWPWTRNELGPVPIDVAGQDDLENTIGNWWNGNCGEGSWQASFSNDPGVYDSNPYNHAIARIPVDIAPMPKACPY